MKRRYIFAAAVMLLLTGCGSQRTGYENFTAPEQGASTLKPVSDIYAKRYYEGVSPTAEKTLETVTTGGGACVIERKKSYYDITLDYDKGSPDKIGAAYAEAIQKVYPDYAGLTEPYIYENIKAAFPNLAGDYTALQNRITAIFGTLRKSYQDELRGFAETIAGDTTGFCEDGILSKQEAILMQLVPDVLRGTACSGITASGSATASGERITCRVLEWQLGSENQICAAHALLHMKHGDESFTSVNLLGFLTILTAINDEGVMMSILDVGSKNEVPYTTEDKRSYTYDIRYALEHCGKAREAAAYLVDNAAHYPYCVNVLCTDANDACVAELCVDAEEGTPIMRDENTPLHDGLKWDDPAYLCVVNSFAAKGNADLLTHNAGNIIRWNRYLDLFGGQRNLTIGGFKERMTAERTDNELVRIRSDSVVHMVIADYDTHSLQAILTGTDGAAEIPEFIDLGKWE